MFAAMKNYTRHVVHTSSVSGLPAQRPLFLNYPSDRPSYDVKYQYMYGEDVLVAPVYLPDMESWDVYLPSDPEASWIFLWEESTTSKGGETVTVESPLGRPPVFYRNSSDFVGVFRQVAAEPLIDLPAYIPESQRASTSVPAHEPMSCSAPRFLAESIFVVAVVLFVTVFIQVRACAISIVETRGRCSR